MMMRFLRNGRDTLFSATSSAGRAFSLLAFEVRGLQAAAYILAFSSLLSSLLALLRDRLLAHLFGAGPTLDVYYAAFRIPDAVFIGIGALVSAYMLIPELARRTDEERKHYLDNIIAGYALLVAIVGAAAFVLAPIILERLFPVFAGSGSFQELIILTRILLLQAVLLGFSNIAAALTQFKHRYALYALSPIVYNFGIIFGALALYPRYGLTGLVWGVCIGAALHLGIQLPSILRDGFLRRLPRLNEPQLFWDTVRLSLPRALALSMSQLAFLGLISLAGTLAAGSISVFMFAYNLQGVPLGIIGASYATAAFPTLAAAFSEGKSREFALQISIAARQILFWSMPALVLAIVLRAHVVRAVLGSGAFDWTDTRLTAAAFALFVVSLVAQGLSLLIIRALYAAGKTFIPFVLSLFTGALTLGLGIAFLRILENNDANSFIESFLRVQDVAGTQILGLALAYSAASIIGMLFIALYFQAHFGVLFESLRRTWWESLLAGLAAGCAAYITLNIIGDVTFASTLLSVLLKGAAAGCIGIGAAAFVYWLLGSREFAENVQVFRRALWKEATPVTSAEQTA